MPRRPSHSFVARLRGHQTVIGQLLRGGGPVWLLSQMPGNAGDQLIWAGTERLLRAEQIEYRRVTVSDLSQGSADWREGTLVVPGSGAMTRFWHEWLPATIKSASKFFDRIVILPSEYEPDVALVRNALSSSNVFAFAREVGSYGRIKHLGRAALAPDPALYAFDFQPVHGAPRSDEALGQVLVSMRGDAGSLLHEQGLQPAVGNDDISLTAAELKGFLDVVRAADTVVTDRLHVTVAGVMLGKTVRFVDPYNEKISKYIHYNFRGEFSGRLQQRDMAWMVRRGYVTMLEARV